MKLSLRLSFAVCGAFVIVGSSFAQQTSFADLVNGSGTPPSIRIAELTSDYKAMRLRSAGETSPGFMGSMGGIMMMASMGGGQGSNKIMPAMFQLSTLNDLIWTKGQTISLAGHDFLVTYKVNTGFDMTSLNSPAPKLAASLTLNLLRTDTIVSVAPDAMTPDQLRAMLKAADVQQDGSPLKAEGGQEDTTTAAILFPVFAQAKVAAQQTSALSNVKQIALSAIMYSGDYDDVLPYVQGTEQFKKVTMPYLRSNEVWKTPNPNGGSFRFAMNLAGVSEVSIENPAETPMIYESNAWPDGKRVVAFADGHAKRVSKEEWAVIEPRLKTKYPRTAKAPIKG